ncbi:hypothetical protein BBJ28_00014758, partial [Nothophytophthora sp. Chile5]
AWYNDVGVALMLTMIVNSFSNHAYVLASYVKLKTRRFYDRGFSFDHSVTRQDTQRDLEALYRGTKFDLAARYAQSLTSIFISYLVRSLQSQNEVAPLKPESDSNSFLRIARSPPLYDSKVATAAGSLLPYAALLHCLVAMWMFSNDRIFQSVSDETLAAANSSSSPGDGIPSFDTAHRGQLITRVTRPEVLVLFVFFVAVCTIVLLRILLFEYAPAILHSVLPTVAQLLEKPRVAKGVPNYFDGTFARLSMCQTHQFLILPPVSEHAAIPTACLQEKLAAMGGTQQLVRPELRAKYENALAKRREHEDTVPKKRLKHSRPATERCSHANWIVGCPSYGTSSPFSLPSPVKGLHVVTSCVILIYSAISDNKEYVAELALDSHLSEEIPLDQIF